MKKSCSLLIIFFFAILLHPVYSSPEGYLIKFRVRGIHDTTCMIANYYGNGTYVKDTVKVDAFGRFVFKADQDLPKGIYLVVITEKSFFQFIVNKDKKFSMETDLKDLESNISIKDSPENSLFYEYLKYNQGKYEEMMKLNALAKKTKDNKDSLREINQRVDSLNNILIRYKLDLVKKYPDSFVAFFINAMKEPEIPEIPVLPNGRKDSTFAYNYYKNHFWDGTDFTDDRLLRTPIFHNKLKKYFDDVLIQNTDTLIKETDLLIEKSRPNAEMFKYLVWFVTNHYETSEIMGFDRIFVHIIDFYYVTGQASWVNKTVLENLIKKSNKLKPLLIGEKAPNMIMLDTNNQLISMHNIETGYLILLFWDPDCGHCEQEMPKLKDFYDKNKASFGLEIFAVCSDTSLVKWKSAIKKRGMNWINVDGPRSLTGNYHDQYDITTTPVIYILDRKKMIIAKHLRAEQLSQFFKNYNLRHPVKEQNTNKQITEKDDVLKSQSFIIPEKLWKTDCPAMAQNIVIQRLPGSNGSMNIALAKSDTSVSYLTGNICDMVKGYDYSSFNIYSGKYLIKPCDGSVEKDIEIISQGLKFIYHSGIGLEYISGTGIINMFGKSYEFPIDEWKTALKDNKIVGYRTYIKNNPTGLHVQDALSRIEILSYEQCLKDDRYSSYNQFLIDFPGSKNANKIKNILSTFKKVTFSNDTILTDKVFIQKYHWNGQNELSIIDEKGFRYDVDMVGKNWVSGNFALGNLEFINAKMTKVDGGKYLVKGSGLIYKVLSKRNSEENQLPRSIKK